MVGITPYPTLMVNIWVLPNAKHTQIVGMEADYLKIKLHAPAIDNKANESLVAFLSKSFKTAKSNITLVKGQHHRKKQLEIRQATILPEWACFFLSTYNTGKNELT